MCVRVCVHSVSLAIDKCYQLFLNKKLISF